MAEKTTDKKPNIFSRARRAIKDMRGEMSRVVWPSKKQTINNTVIVIAFMAIMAVIIGLFDTGLSAIVKAVFGA